jgi:hypothetical protein
MEETRFNAAEQQLLFEHFNAAEQQLLFNAAEQQLLFVLMMKNA